MPKFITISEDDLTYIISQIELQNYNEALDCLNNLIEHSDIFGVKKCPSEKNKE
jgi:hypothetical protein